MWKKKEKLPAYITENITEDLIKLVDMVKIYDTGSIKVLGLKRVNLTIKRGEFVAIMGQSGSGKSTLMNILGCLDRPTMGHYYLDGIDTAKMPPDDLSSIRNRKIGFVFQSFNLISRTSALKNVELPMTYAHKSKKEREKRALELLDRVGLGSRYEHMPNELSGGQRQRVAIARALANEPPLILADEPTGNLDSTSSLEIMELFSKLHDEGATVVLVTHEEDIAAYTERILRFRDGDLISDTPNVPRKLVQRSEEEVTEDAEGAACY
ncbi:ABC transporter ATP-binding protein [Clostridium sp. E02]|uniref:ABC transporter ATP-binding protein n=1 Tax=Clostridium sp. E02 TaxID=2487134 RepID=UPI000F53921A|nr:ABC transporter ATP-binding protein [Clostridium sp. E02]